MKFVPILDLSLDKGMHLLLQCERCLISIPHHQTCSWSDYKLGVVIYKYIHLLFLTVFFCWFFFYFFKERVDFSSISL